MAQTNFINATFSSIRDQGVFRTTLAHGSSSAGDATFSWDSGQFTTRTALKDFLQKCITFIDSRRDIPL